MRHTDRFLVGIVAGVVLLVVISFVISVRQPLPAFLPDDTPEGVVQNYLLALKQTEYDRAYGYLSPELPGFPSDVAVFAADVTGDRWAFRLDENVSLEITSSTVTDETAAVIIRETRFQQAGLFGSGQSVSSFTVKLRRASGSWLITDSGAYWSWCWNSDKECPANR